MPELLQLNNMGLKGLSTDPLPWELPPEFITSGINFRIFAGALITSGGWRTWATYDGANPADNFGFLMHAGATSSDNWLVCGRDHVYAYNGGTWFDVTSAVGYPSVGPDQELDWTGCMLGKIPILNNPQAQPEYWSPQSGGQILQPLPFSPTESWSDKGFGFDVIRSHKNFLFALNLKENGVEEIDAFRWSHPADINGLPFTWDETDEAALAGKAALGGDGGAIIDGQSLRDASSVDPG